MYGRKEAPNMTVCMMEDPGGALPPGGGLLRLDVGERTVGLAVSDSGLTSASPIGTIRRTKFQADATELLRIVDDRGVGGLVVGLPINMDGSEGPRAASTRQFAYNLLDRRDLPIAFWDERLSTMAEIGRASGRERGCQYV